jgi:hypothetical protein
MISAELLNPSFLSTQLTLQYLRCSTVKSGGMILESSIEGDSAGLG